MPTMHSYAACKNVLVPASMCTCMHASIMVVVLLVRSCCLSDVIVGGVCFFVSSVGVPYVGG